MKINHNDHQRQQSGIASFLFCLVMMIVISLIVLSFAQLARRGQREALDSQLSGQAYYAAETGVNDAKQAVAQLLQNGQSIDNTGCGLNGAYQTYYSQQSISQTIGSGVSYTCLSVNASPRSLQIPLTTASSKLLTIHPANPIQSLTLTWTANSTADRSNCPSATSVNSDFTPYPSWHCPYGIVRFDLVPTSGALSRTGLLANSLSVFAVPTKATTASANTVGFIGNTGKGIRGQAFCDDPATTPAATCKLVINNLPAGNYALRALSIYDDIATLSVTGQDITGADVAFNDGQAVIDVTGQAQDVRRRLQERVPLSLSGVYADYAIGTQNSICKHFEVASGYFNNPDNTCPTN